LLQMCSSILVMGSEFDKVHDIVTDFIAQNNSATGVQKENSLDLLFESTHSKFDCVILSLDHSIIKERGLEQLAEAAIKLTNRWLIVVVPNIKIDLPENGRVENSGATGVAMLDHMRSLEFEVFGTSGLKLFRYLTKWIKLDFTSLDNLIADCVRNVSWNHPRQSYRLIGLKEPDGDVSKYYRSHRNEMSAYIPATTKRLLDIGCGAGNFGASLKKNSDVEIWGIEFSSKAAQIASKKLDHVITGDVNQSISNLPNNYFDCIVFNDVLEHLVDPYGLLPKIKNLLSKDGMVVASIPNVRHTSVLWDLLVHKEWKYAESGVLDKTHLRFFTKKSILRMFDQAGYDCKRIKGINSQITPGFIMINILLLGTALDARFTQYSCAFKPK